MVDDILTIKPADRTVRNSFALGIVFQKLLINTGFAKPHSFYTPQDKFI
jgi:hypothetical protein